MKISTKGRYGLRALMDLAVHSSGETTTLANIAERQQISTGYLEQIFSVLRKANIVIGTKGPQGGYALAGPAGQLLVGNILNVLEGDLFSIADDKVTHADACCMQAAIRQHVWDRITQAAASALDGLTLGDLVEAYEQNKPNDVLNFCI